MAVFETQTPLILTSHAMCEKTSLSNSLQPESRPVTEGLEGGRHVRGGGGTAGSSSGGTGPGHPDSESGSLGFLELLKVDT